MAALTYTAVLGLECVSWGGGQHGEKGRTGRREVGGRGAPLKAASEPLSDGLSTQHSCFRQSQGSGGSSGPFHLHMAFLRSRPSGMLALPHFTPSATHRSFFLPSLRLSSPTSFMKFLLFYQHAGFSNCDVNSRSARLACGNPSLCADLSFMSHTLEKYTVCLLFVRVRWEECR